MYRDAKLENFKIAMKTAFKGDKNKQPYKSNSYNYRNHALLEYMPKKKATQVGWGFWDKNIKVGKPSKTSSYQQKPNGN